MHRSVGLQSSRCQSLDSGGIPDVGHLFDHLGPGAAQLRTRHRKPRSIEVGGHNPHALLRESTGDARPDAAARPGDDRHPARELFHNPSTS